VIHATIYNSLPDSTITVFGFQERPGSKSDSLFLLPGASTTIRFSAGKPGTYFYSIVLGKGVSLEIAEEEQLAGAFIIDPREGSPPDRIFVMNIFSTPVDETFPPTKWLEFLTINGKSWPHTEAFQFSVGDTVRWRIINASKRGHPMHLHGFYYDVLSIGDELTDTVYSPESKRKVVTETMRGQNTMVMEWVTMRPGRWLFHCHLSGHISPEIRLPGSAEVDKDDANEHMAGLVIGINILDGKTDLISKGEPKELTLYAHQYDSTAKSKNGFSLSATFDSTLNFPNSPGPLLLLNQYQTTYITLENHLSFPTSVHWHGLEIDSWSDGVPEWSSSDGRYSPSVFPGEKFTYKLSAMRPGSFIYHSHLDDIYQLTSGLYGPMIVLGENEIYHPETDHVYIVNHRTPGPKSSDDMELNGTTIQPRVFTTVGVTHRLRLMNIAPSGDAKIYVKKNNTKIAIRHIAKDGMDLPENQVIQMIESPMYGVGETSDFSFTPTHPGSYTLFVYSIDFGINATWHQEWVVASK
jgi:FtsP/CotA-like multicopper oxidase with cupredoxin domain